MRFSPISVIVFAFVISATLPLHGGDAVLWDARAQQFFAQYSSTPSGGNDYATGEQASAAVAKTMLRQGRTEPVTVWKSDRAGFFTVWTGVNAAKKMLAAVGFGATEGEAKVQGLAKIREAGAQSNFFIAQRYTSYGDDYTPGMPTLPDLSISAVQTEEIDSFSPDNQYALCTSHSRGWKLRRLDLVNLKTFERVLELGMPSSLFGSIVWSADSRRFAFFGEERAYGETAAYTLEDGKCTPLLMPERDKLPDADLGLKDDERIFETKNDAVRPKAWLPSGDLQLEHFVEIAVEKGIKVVGTAEATTALTVHFSDAEGPSILSVTQSVVRKAAPQLPPKPKELLSNPKDLSAKPDGTSSKPKESPKPKETPAKSK